MNPGRIRRFQIRDGLVLVAATGLGLGGCRLWLLLIGDTFAGLMMLNPGQLSDVTFSEVASELSVRMLVTPFDDAVGFGGAIVLIWLVTWASGRCRPVPSWIDRACRVLGAAWVALTVFSVLGV
jgi:hypothetical protein